MRREDQTNDGTGAAGVAAGGAPASGAPDAGSGGGGTGASAAPAGSTPAAPSIFSQAAGAIAPVIPSTPSTPGTEGALPGKVARDAAVPVWVPEQFKTGEDFAKSYGELTKRMIDIGLPPKTADEYEWKAPEGMQLNDESSKEFRIFAHENGFSKKQYGAMMDAYTKNLEGLVSDMHSLTASRAEASLRKEWKTDDEYTRQITSGYKTLQAFSKPEELKAWDEVNHPAVWRLLARIGSELGEDAGLGNTITDVSSAEVELNNLTKYDEKSAYWDKRHPDHARSVEHVQGLQRALVARRKRGE